MDAVFLSRLQFALHISFHYLFPPMTIGLSVLIVMMEAIYLVTKKKIYEQMAQFWVHIFAIIFAVGVATGLVQVFSFGSNWGRFSHFVGDIFGSILGAEGIFAFFLESGFVALLIFGWKRVKPGIHFLSTILVSLGAHFSALWIVVANSWMQSPAGYQFIGEGEGSRLVLRNWWQVVNNPSSLDRLAHVIISCWITGAFLVISVCAYYLWKQRHQEFARRSMKLALYFGAFSLVAQLVSGDSTARLVSKIQPIKMAAMEGIFHTEPSTPISVIGYANQEEKKTIGLKLPGFLSLLLYHNPHQPVPGLDQFPEEFWPPVNVVFQTYHLMIMMWVLMVVVLFFVGLAYRNPHRSGASWMWWTGIISVAFPQIANQMGWYTAEIGRQPWVVYGLMRTSDGISLYVQPGQILFSLILFALVYAFVFAMFLYLLDRKIKKGPIGGIDVDEYRNPYLEQGVPS